MTFGPKDLQILVVGRGVESFPHDYHQALKVVFGVVDVVNQMKTGIDRCQNLTQPVDIVLLDAAMPHEYIPKPGQPPTPPMRRTTGRRLIPTGEKGQLEGYSNYDLKIDHLQTPTYSGWFLHQFAAMVADPNKMPDGLVVVTSVAHSVRAADTATRMHHSLVHSAKLPTRNFASIVLGPATAGGTPPVLLAQAIIKAFEKQA